MVDLLLTRVLQVGKFVVGAPENPSNQMIAEDDMPADLRFPTVFRGRGIRGHRYEEFEPRYFV